MRRPLFPPMPANTEASKGSVESSVSSNNSMHPLLAFTDVSVNFYKNVALAGVSVQVHADERVAVIGPSGAGKSTLLGLCNGTVIPTSGHVYFRGEPVRDRDAWRRLHGSAVGTVHQQLHLAGRLRAIHNVNSGRLSEWSVARALLSLVIPQEVAAARATLERVGIADKLFERTDRLSGGERQRLAIARALRQDPALMLADEPTASLDSARALEVMMLLSEVAAGDGRALLVSQHDVDLALRTCDRIIGLREGTIRFDLPADSVDAPLIAELYRIEHAAR